MKKLIPRSVVALVIGFLFAFHGRAAESLSVLLQKGIYAEETEGNLDSAIKIYEQIATEGATNRSLVAQAQFRLAVCYQKQGKKESAVAAFNDLLKQFPSEMALTQKAREQLAALGHAAPETVTLRKIAVVQNWVRDISPSGQFVAYTGNNGEIFMLEPATGKTWEPVKGDWDNGPWGFVFSPDGRRIAYEKNGKAIVVANVGGSDARQIYATQDKEYIQPYAWLGATGRIVAVRTDNANGGVKSLVAIDPQSGEVARSHALPLNGGTWAPSLSGRYVAFVNGTRLLVMNLETGQQERVVDYATQRLIAWAHDDAELFFCSDRSGVSCLCVVEMREGKPISEPRTIREYNANIRPEYVTPDGQIYFRERDNTANVYVVAANLETGKIIGAPRLATERFPGMQTRPVWSKDGRKLWLSVAGEKRQLLAVSIATGRQEDFPLNHLFSNALKSYSLSNDETFVLADGAAFSRPNSRSGVFGLYRYELGSGKLETLATTTSANWIWGPRLAPDGKSFYYTRDTRERSGADSAPRPIKVAIIRREVASEQQEVLYESAGKRLLSSLLPVEPAPDGSRLAFATTDESVNEDYTVAIELLDIVTRQTRELLRLSARESMTSLVWTPDGRRLIYTKSTPARGIGQPPQTTVWSAAIDSGKVVPVDLGISSVVDVAIGPDGRQIAFRTGSVGDTAQLWAMEGVRASRLPPTALGPRTDVIARDPIIAPDEMKGPNNSIIDRQLGVTMVLPRGWSLAEASRRADPPAAPHLPQSAEGFTGLRFSLSGREAFVRMSYYVHETPQPMAASELEASLRDWRTKNLATFHGGFDNIREREGSLVSRSLAGGTALSWSADFTRQGAKWVGYWTAIRNENGHVFLYGWAPEAESESIRTDFANLAETVRLEKRPSK